MNVWAALGAMCRRDHEPELGANAGPPPAEDAERAGPKAQGEPQYGKATLHRLFNGRPSWTIE